MLGIWKPGINLHLNYLLGSSSNFRSLLTVFFLTLFSYSLSTSIRFLSTLFFKHSKVMNQVLNSHNINSHLYCARCCDRCFGNWY